jgi:hypothetical protein
MPHLQGDGADRWRLQVPQDLPWLPRKEGAAMTQIDELRAALVQLRDERDALRLLEIDMSGARAEFDKRQAPLITEVRDTQAVVAALEAHIRFLALHCYDQENRRPTPGVELKEFTVIEYDPAPALAWAQSHGLCLALDKRAFERLAKDVPAMIGDIVTVTKDLRVTISTDLTKALGEVQP